MEPSRGIAWQLSWQHLPPPDRLVCSTRLIIRSISGICSLSLDCLLPENVNNKKNNQTVIKNGCVNIEMAEE